MKKLSEINDEDLGKNVYILGEDKIKKGVVCASHKVTFEDCNSANRFDCVLHNPIRIDYKSTDRFMWAFCKIDTNIPYETIEDFYSKTAFWEDTTFEKCSDTLLMDKHSKVCFNLDELKDAFIEKKREKIKELQKEIDILNKVIEIVEDEGIFYYMNIVM